MIIFRPFESFFFFFLLPSNNLLIYFIQTAEFTDSQSENHFGVSSIFVCGQKLKVDKIGRKIRSVHAV